MVKSKVDFAWLISATAQSGTVGFSVPSSGISKLSIANPAAADTTLQLIQNGGAASSFTVPAAGQLTLKFAPGAKLKLSSEKAPFFGTMIVDVDGSLAAVPLLDYKNPGGQVAVMVR